MDHKEIYNEIEDLQIRLNQLRSSLRKEVVTEHIPKGLASFIQIKVGADHCAILLDSVEEVIMYCTMVPIPESPGWVAGFLNLRGEMVPVIDVLARVTSKSRMPDLSDLVLITRVEGKKVGLILQEVIDVIELDSGLLQNPALEFPLAPYILGVFSQEEKSIFLLSVSCLIKTSGLPEDSE